MASKAQQLDFVKQIYPAADRLWKREICIPPLFVTAQAALETGWRIAGISNNVFGIMKGSSWKGETVLKLTSEVFDKPDVKFTLPEEVESVTLDEKTGLWNYRVYRLFRVYDSLEACLADHLAVLKKAGYADAWPYREDPREFARRIVDVKGSKYATAPNYATLMISMINTVERLVKELSL
ncbi:MAG: glucosaminidase domain-containing protein [Tannerella sp.]|jgi:flagellar protein FlgJ|nr:glucosaminidase domain-containing protein [Tannerella sp.]